jgi:hypothetical protein
VILKMLVPVLLIVALAVILVHRRDTEPGGHVRSVTGVEPRQTDHVVSTTADTDSVSVVDVGDSDIPALDAVGDATFGTEQSTHSDGGRRGFGADQSVLTNSGDLNVSDAPASAGVQGPFEVSDAVLASCEGLDQSPNGGSSSRRGVDPSCAELRKYLSHFENEHRDRTWAAAMEEKLLDHIASAPNECRVRLLECRATVCAFECESAAGPLYLHHEELEDHLRHVDSMFGYDNDAAGGRLTVTLAVYVRR